jgi:hypothetical protein
MQELTVFRATPLIFKLPLQHLLPLPGFLLLYQNIADHFISALHSKPLTLQLESGEINLLIPSMIAYLIGYVLMQVRHGPMNGDFFS